MSSSDRWDFHCHEPHGLLLESLSASFRNLTQQSLLNELLVFLWVSGAKISKQKSSNNSSQKKKKEEEKEETKANKTWAPLKSQICL